MANDDVVLDYTEWRRTHLPEYDNVEDFLREAEEISRRLRAERANMDVALRMLDDGLLPIDKIASYCGLSPEAVQRLAEQRAVFERRPQRT